MPEMRLSIVDEDTWNQNWERYSSINYTDEVLACEQKEQGQIEQLISEKISEDFSEGYDWVVDHFSTPSYVFTITLQNADMFSKDLIMAIHDTVRGFSDRWSLNLGLVDAIHDGIWNSIDDVATLFCTHKNGIILRHSKYESLEPKFWKWISDISQPKAKQ